MLIAVPPGESDPGIDPSASAAPPGRGGLPHDTRVRGSQATHPAACAQHRQDEVKQEAEAFALIKAKGVQINEVKDIREFQDRAAPVWKFLEGKVGKEFFDRVVAEAKAAAK
jgi:TRAP-type C4-dicarboxylate transport system substrate-binding protein